MSNNTATNVWLRSSKISIYGEGLADKGFEHSYLIFSKFNKVRTPRMSRDRELKKYDVSELLTKDKYCKLRLTTKVVFYFLENTDMLKDGASFNNINLTSCTLEWEFGSANIQQPLKTPGS